jgi:ribonuclease HII
MPHHPNQPDLFEALDLTAAGLCGVDEAGRGPLAGPVYAAAVVLDPEHPIDGLADSKTLSPQTRDGLAEFIRARALGYAIAWASVREIDRLNILHASMLAMQRAVLALSVSVREVYVDGNRCPELPHRATAIVKGDSLVPAISAASILAKTARDAAMVKLARRYPHYGFAQHKGYPTPAHLDALRRYGPCPVHRRSFAPVQEALARAQV